MNNWKTIVFFTLVGLAVLIQVVVLRWGMEAVFFVTWFLLMLGVKHDTRLSPALGLVFLAACPFLLIADKEPAAEQAANYAYFFLAIGVLVQVEEMILERNNRLGWKADISFLWGPVVDQVGEISRIDPFQHRNKSRQDQQRPLDFHHRDRRTGGYLFCGCFQRSTAVAADAPDGGVDLIPLFRMGAPAGPACHRASQAFTSSLDAPASAFTHDGRDMDQRFNRCVSTGKYGSRLLFRRAAQQCRTFSSSPRG